MANLCGKNVSIEGMEDLQKELGSLAEGGKELLADVESLIGDVETQVNDALGKVEGELPPEAKNLQKELASLQEAKTPEEFFAKVAEINDDFGEAMEEANIKLEELGLGSFPPTADATQSFLEKETGIDLAAVASGDLSSIQAKIDEATEAGETPPNIQQIISGDFSSLGVEVPEGEKGICALVPNLEIPPGSEDVVERKSDSQIAFKIPVESIKKEIKKAQETAKAILLFERIRRDTKTNILTVVYDREIAKGRTDQQAANEAKSQWISWRFAVQWAIADILSLTIAEYSIAAPGIKVDVPEEYWPLYEQYITNPQSPGEETIARYWQTTIVDPFNALNTTSLTIEETIIAWFAGKLPREEIVEEPPANARVFTGKYVKETEKLVNYNGKTYVVPKAKNFGGRLPTQAT